MKSIDNLVIAQCSETEKPQNHKSVDPLDAKGRCLVTWCNCESFVENSASWPKCATCGHDYADHGK